MKTILEKDGKPIGVIYMAFSVANDSHGTEIEIVANDCSPYLTEALYPGVEIYAASTSQKCNVVSLDGVFLKVDKKICSINRDYLMKGDIIMIKDAKHS